MTDRQIEVLKMTEFGVDYYDVPEPSDRGILMYLEENKYCYVKNSSTVYQISEKGREYLHSLEQINKENAEKERKYNEQIAKADKDRKEQLRHNWRVYITSAIVGSITTLIVEHFIDILLFLSSFFHKITP